MLFVGGQVHKASLSVLGVGISCFIRQERPPFAVQFAMWSLQFLLQVPFSASSSKVHKLDTLVKLINPLNYAKQLEVWHNKVCSCASHDRHRNGPVGMRRLPHLTHVHSRSDKRTVLLLSHRQPCLGRYWIIYEF